MIITKLQGGLGNQMFQYALGRRLSLLNETELKLDISAYDNLKKNDTPRKYSLGCFNIEENFAEKEDFKKINLPDMASKNIMWRIYRKFFRDMEAKKPQREQIYVREPYFGFCADILKLKKNIYLNGNWQNEKYFKEVGAVIRKDFTLKRKSGQYERWADKISKAGHSVSLHIRRGDYVHDEKTNRCHGVCDLRYYEKAIAVIGAKTKSPVIFIFSDDIHWAKANIKTKHQTLFVSGNGLKDCEEMVLMSKCENNIIANSSFSWWGAWLNKNKEKTIISPKQWFADPARTDDNPCPPNWIQI